MAPPTLNPTSSRRSSQSSSSRRASTGPRTPPSQPTAPSSPSAADAPAGYSFAPPTPIQIKRTINITVEISSGTALANHMDVSQYHMPVTTSCYSPTSSSSYEYQASASWYGAPSSYAPQGAAPLTPSLTTTSSDSHGQAPANGIQGSSYEYAHEPSEYNSTSSEYQQQHGQYPSSDYPSSQDTFSSTSFFSSSLPSTKNRRSGDYSHIARYTNTSLRPIKRKPDTSFKHAFPAIEPARMSMLERFLMVDSREDALVIEARAAIQEGRVTDGNGSPNTWGWESIIDNL